MVRKLYRLARNTIEGIEVIESLFSRGIKVHVMNVCPLENRTMERFFLTTILAVVEMKRNVTYIVERTQEGKRLAKLRDDFREDRPRKYFKQKVHQASELLKTHTYKEVEGVTGMKKRTLINRKNEYEANQLYRTP